MAARGDTYDAVIASPIGRLGVLTDATAVLAIDFLPNSRRLKSARNELAQRACAQLQAYFVDPYAVFDLPLALLGTPFQRRVWRALRAIPPGTVLSYGQMAERIGSGARAVGGACRSNPVPIIVPCHRVVARDGLGGYSGATRGIKMATKRWLLEHERR